MKYLTDNKQQYHDQLFHRNSENLSLQNGQSSDLDA